MNRKEAAIPDTWFASPERSDEITLKREIRQVEESPVMDGLLNTVGGLLAILNEDRQIIAVNATLEKKLQVKNLGDLIGLRPGEALDCLHSTDGPGGCGTGPFCSSCGAALSIVSSLGMNEPVERNCYLEVRRGEATANLAFQVRAHPVSLDKSRYVLLFLQDITDREKRVSLERTFFHDINNLLQGLNAASDMLLSEEGDNKLVDIVSHASRMLIKEVEIQRCLLREDPLSCRMYRQDILLSQLMGELETLFSDHILTKECRLIISPDYGDFTFKTDMALLVRVLSNMIINGLEASGKGDSVPLWTERDDKRLRFRVKNGQAIPDETARRIFQRNYSTKEEPGRGMGTYSMKLLGEKILGGRVEFTTDSAEGTVFTYSLPLTD